MIILTVIICPFRKNGLCDKNCALNMIVNNASVCAIKVIAMSKTKKVTSLDKN